MTSTLEPRELARDLELLRGGQPGARRLLPVAQRRVEDPDRARRDAAAEPRLPVASNVIASPPPRYRAGGRLRLPGLDDDRVEERHLRPQVRPDLLDLVVPVLLAQPPELLAAGVLDRDPARRERPALDVGQHVLHRGLGALGDPRAGDVVAVLGRVAHGEAHVVEPAAVHEVHDQLELVHRLEVRELGLVAGLDERLERRLDERRHAAAQQRLLAEQVGLGLLLERRLEHAGARRPDPAGVGEDAGAGRPGRILLDREQRRHAAALLVDAAQQVARALGRDHADVDVRPRLDPREPDVEAVREHQQLAGPQVGLDLGVVDRLLGGVGDRDHDHVGGLDGLGDVLDPQPRRLGERAALASPGRARP